MATKQSFKNGVEYANESFGHRCDENKYDYDQLKEAFDAGQGSLRDHFAGLAMQGMLVGTLVSLFVVPALYYSIYNGRKKK